MNIQEFRGLYPEYNDMPDQALADSLYQKHYSDMDRKAFDSKFLGISPPAQPQAPAPSPTDPMAASMGMFQPENMQAPPVDQLAGIPKQFAQGMVEQLPIAGMIGGGAIGSIAGPPGIVAGASLGGGIGAGARGAIQTGMGWRKPPTLGEAAGEMGKEAMYAGLTQMSGPLLATGLQKITSPFAGRVAARAAKDPAISAALGLVEQGAPISPEVIAGTKTARFFDWAAEKLWPASAIMANKRQGLQKVADSLKDEFVNTRGIYNTSKAGTNEAWENWVKMAGGAEAPYELPKTLQVITEASKKPFAMELKSTTDAVGNVVTQEAPIGAFWKKYASTFKQSLEENGQVTVQEIRDLLNVLNPTGAKGAERTARMKIADAIMEDLGKSGNEEMVKALANAKDLARLQRIAAPLQAIFNKATIPAKAAGDEVTFSPSNFVNLWQQRRGNFLTNKNYSAEDIRVIDKFADKMKALVPDLALGSKYQFAGLTQTSPANPLGAGALAYKFPGIVIPSSVADSFLAFSLMNPNGIMRKFLTTGFKPPTLSSKVGIMSGMEGLND